MTQKRPAPSGLLAVTLIALSALLAGCSGATSPEAASPQRPAPAPDATYLVNEGRAAAARGDTVRAEQYIALAIERGYDERRALPPLLSACIRGSRLRAALNHAERYLRDHPHDTALRYLVATIQVGLGDEESGRRELEALLEDEPDHGEALFLLGVLDLDRDPARARERLRTYLRLQPTGRHAADARVRLRELERRDGEDARLLGLTTRDDRAERASRREAGRP